MRAARRTHLLVLLCLSVLVGCDALPGRATASNATNAATAPLSSSPQAGRGQPASCPDADDARRAICAYLTALDSGDVSGLGDDEQRSARSDDQLRRGPWEVLDCSTDGPSTCEVSIGLPGSEPQLVLFTLEDGEAADQVAYYEVREKITSDLEGCPVEDVVERTACEFLTAVETSEPQLLRDDERRLLRTPTCRPDAGNCSIARWRAT